MRLHCFKHAGNPDLPGGPLSIDLDRIVAVERIIIGLQDPKSTKALQKLGNDLATALSAFEEKFQQVGADQQKISVQVRLIQNVQFALQQARPAYLPEFECTRIWVDTRNRDGSLIFFVQETEEEVRKLIMHAPHLSAFVPTHRHADGGLYQVVDGLDFQPPQLHIDGKWVDGVRYKNADGQEFIREQTEFDRRFTRLEQGGGS